MFFRQLISLFVVPSLILSSLPFEAATNLHDSFDEAKGITDSLFDGTKSLSPGVRPSSPVSIPRQRPSHPLLLAQSLDDHQRLNQCFGEGKNCGTLPKPKPLPPKEPGYIQPKPNPSTPGDPGPSSKGEPTSSRSEEEAITGFLGWGLVSLLGIIGALGVGGAALPAALQALSGLVGIFAGVGALAHLDGAFYLTKEIIVGAFSFAAGPILSLLDAFIPGKSPLSEAAKELGPLSQASYWATRVALLLGSLAYFPLLGAGILSGLPLVASVPMGIASGGILVSNLLCPAGRKIKNSISQALEERRTKTEEERQRKIEEENQKVLQERLDNQDQYIEAKGLDLKTIEDARKRLGTNPWEDGAFKPDTILNDPEKLQSLKDFDLRYFVSMGDFDEEGNPKFGTISRKDGTKITSPPVVIPAKLSIRTTKQKNGQKETEVEEVLRVRRLPKEKYYHHNGKIVKHYRHDGVDIKAKWRRDGFALPIGLSRDVVVVEARWQQSEEKDKATGMGNYLVVQEKDNPSTFWILGHAGLDEDPDFAKEHQKQYHERLQEIRGKSGILVKEGDHIPAYRPLILMGHSGNADADDPHVHLEKIVLPQERMVEAKKKLEKIERLRNNGDKEDKLIKDVKALDAKDAIAKYQNEVLGILFTKSAEPEKVFSGEVVPVSRKKYAVDPLSP